MANVNMGAVIGGVRRLHRRLFRKKEDERIRERVDALTAAPVFSGVPRRHLRSVAEVMHERSFRRDENVYYEDDPGLGLYLICRGKVRLSRKDESDQEYQIAELGVTDVFGVLSVFEDLRRSESAQSLADTVVLGLFRPDLNAIAHRNPAAGVAVYRALARHVGRFYALLLQSVENRVGRDDTMVVLAEAASGQTAT